MKDKLFSQETLVSEALAAAPGLSRVLIARRTACVGCALARFCTLADVARTYGFSLESFLYELESTAAVSPSLTTGVHDEKTQ